MKKLYLIIFLLFINISFSDNLKENKILDKTKCEKIMETGDNDLIARSGCCSWHGGVCGCGQNGRVICCDDTYSPSCTCRSGKINELPNIGA